MTARAARLAALTVAIAGGMNPGGIPTRDFDVVQRRLDRMARRSADPLAAVRQTKAQAKRDRKANARAYAALMIARRSRSQNRRAGK